MQKLLRSVSMLVLSLVLFSSQVWAFSDVAPTAPESEAVAALVQNGKIGGSENFFPQRTATRCEYLKMLVSPIPKGTNLEIIKMPYKDVVEFSWCGDAVKYALLTGVLSGKGGTFRPQDPILLLDAVRLTYRYYDNFPLVDHLVSVRNYSDINVEDSTLPLYQVEQAVIDGIIHPESESKLGAAKALTRAEVAVMTYEAYKAYDYTRPDINRILFGTADIRTKLAFLGVFNNLSSNYIGRKDIDYGALLRAVIRAAVESTGDKYGRYMDAEEFAKFVDEDYGLYVGLGVQLDESEGKLRISKVYQGSAAERAGILTGDVIISINGVDVQGSTVEAFLKSFTRKAGETVKLEILRPGETTRRVLDITLTKFIVPDVSYRDLGGGIAYFQVGSFGDNTYAQLKDLYSKAASDAKGVIVDLRGNGGGQLSTAIDMASAFLPKGSQVARISDGEGKTVIVKTSKVPFVDKAIPVILLVDGNSASASELFALALRDGRSVKIVGTKTFGKGSVQHVFTYPDGSALKVTVASWSPIKSASVSKVGIVPDSEIVDNPLTSQDDPLQMALSLLPK